jgi:DNA ligase (NAD+)
MAATRETEKPRETEDPEINIVKLRIQMHTNKDTIDELTADKLCELERMGQKSAEKLINAIAQSKTQPWSRVLYGLGIRHVGSVNAQLLTEKFTTVAELTAARQSDIAGVYGIGAEIAQSVYQWFRTPANQSLISRIQAIGLELANSTAAEAVGEINQKFAGKTFVLTGTLPTLKRDEAKALIQKSGGKITDSISRKTDFLVVGADAGSKLEKARKLEISQLTEAQLLAMLTE